MGKRERQDGFTTRRPLRGREVRLYDLERDPGETPNLAARPDLGRLVSELTDALAGHLKSTARQPELLPRDGDVHQMLDACLPSRD